MDARERLTELLARRATAGLDDVESRELKGLLASHPEWDNDSFDRAAAALDLALGEPEELPEGLRRSLLAAGRELADEARATEETAADPGPTATSAPPATGEDAASARDVRRGGMPPWTGWLAAAAALVIALVAWWPRAQTPPASAEMRSRLVDEAGDLVRAVWTATDDPAAAESAGGDVVWSSARQRGYMLLRGLRPNDSDAYQYQLWVFDAGRDERFPVDGGVFDIPRGREEVIVPIDNKLPVDRPTAFAVTVERPGGVVVSDRSRVVLLAEVGDG